MKKLKDKNKSLNKNGERRKKNNEDLINKKKLVDAEKVQFSYFIFDRELCFSLGPRNSFVDVRIKLYLS